MASRPEEAFRIADRRHNIFDGAGAFLHGARWNSTGRRVIYAAETFAGAMLDMLAHTRIGRVPRTHAWVQVSIPADVSVEIVKTDSVPDWDKADSATSRQFGDEWYDRQRTLILVVPSVVTAGITRNILINQSHKEFQLLRPSPPRPLRYGARLFTNT